jgi:hypothetical protein
MWIEAGTDRFGIEAIQARFYDFDAPMATPDADPAGPAPAAENGRAQGSCNRSRLTKR